MRVLLVHPLDWPTRGPWSRQRWDLIVDLGRSSRFSQNEWSEGCGCPVLRSDAFREDIADAKRVRELLLAGSGRLIDEEGLDWWHLTYLLIVHDMLAVLALQRVAPEITGATEIWSTRANWHADVLARLLGQPLRNFANGGIARAANQAGHYAALFRHTSLSEIKQILLDKYDASYRWRARFAVRPNPCTEPVVLLPSAYENVSRVAAAYARMLPEQRFLLIATRWSGRRLTPPANVEVRDLAGYAKTKYPAAEIASIVERWGHLTTELSASAEFRILVQDGILEPLLPLLRDGLCARNAWREAIDCEPICGVLCGDDSNTFTRLPVLLAVRRKIATVDFHHGAFDGYYLMKELPCDVYLAKNEMERDYLLRVCSLPAERVVIGAPWPSKAYPARNDEQKSDQQKKTSVVLFSEPYESAGMRSEEVYREILPPLLRVARENGRSLIIKLHPFESRSQRAGLIRDVFSSSDLCGEDRRLVTVLDGPLTHELLSQIWFGITVESTTVMDCVENGIRCFLCGWLARSSYGYLQQYARFGIGEELEDAEQIRGIPQRLANPANLPELVQQSNVADAVDLRRWLTSGVVEHCGTRSAS
jgi:hypothetical protein